MSSMSHHGEFSRPGTQFTMPPVSAAVFLLLMALASFVASLNFPGVHTHLILFSTAIGLASVGVFTLAWRLNQQLRHAQADQVFSVLTAGHARPSFLTDSDGNVLKSANLTEDMKLDDEEADLCDHINARVPDAPAVIYRILRKVAESGAASEAFRYKRSERHEISAQRCGEGQIYWQLDKAPEMPQDNLLTSARSNLPIFLTDRNGQLRATSEAARTVLEQDGGDASAILKDWQTDKRGVISLPGEPSRRARVTQAVVDERSTTWLLRLLEQEEIAGALPEQFMDALPVALARIAQDGSIMYANDAARGLLGDKAEAGQRLDDLMVGLGRSIPERISDMLKGRSHMPSEVARAKVAGKEVYLQVTMKRLKLSGDVSLIVVMNDATELKTLEAQFVQSQKMQAVGQLAGGVAHDFNNLLTAINGHCDLMVMRHEPNDTDYADLMQIRQNSMRAAALVSKLLAYSRKQTLLPKVFNLYDTLGDLRHLLNRLLGEKVSLTINHQDELPSIRADERQLEQVIMNLVVNARDAMPEGGQVRIDTKSVHFAENTTRDQATIPFGDYIQIDVSDTGMGIPEDMIAKIFEPFFTTKGVGKGTGLGLSTAYGIIKQTGGFIFADSKVGEGSTFTLLLPVMEESPQVAVAPAEPEDLDSKDLTGRGVVLLVEDEDPVRIFATKALNTRGYTVIEAESAERALELLEDDTLHVDVFVSDVVMPGLDGPTWVRQAQIKRPDTKVIFVSGYSEQIFDEGEFDIPNATFLPKPFSLQDLTQTVKAQMGA